jgi:hypothetical protein
VKTSTQLVIAGWLTFIATYFFNLDNVFIAISVQSFIGAMLCKEIEKYQRG